MIPFVIGTAALVGGSIFLVRKRLSGPSLKRYDTPPPLFRDPDPDSPGIARINDYLVENFIKPAQAEGTKVGAMTGWEDKRERFEQAGLARTDLKAEYRDDWVEVEGRKIHGRWTLVDGY